MRGSGPGPEHHLTQPWWAPFIHQMIEHQLCASPCSVHWDHSSDELTFCWKEPQLPLLVDDLIWYAENPKEATTY